MDQHLNQVTDLVKEFENDRDKKYGALAQQLTDLNQTSSLLQRALADSRTRGQWGERMAEDILRMAGLIEGVNYQTQLTVNGSRPDFTFLLPNNLALNMDVKFPLENYMKYMDAEAERDREQCQKAFLTDVRGHIKAVLKRGYINQDQPTVDYVLIFIPNEQIYRFILEADDKLINDCLNNKVVLCSPITLFSVLAIVRQAADNFALERSSREILKLLNDFNKQWDLFREKMGKVEKYLQQASDAYGDLMRTRSNGLERPLKRIEGLMTTYHLEDEEEMEAVLLEE